MHMCGASRGSVDPDKLRPRKLQDRFLKRLHVQVALLTWSGRHGRNPVGTAHEPILGAKGILTSRAQAPTESSYEPPHRYRLV